MKMFFSDKYIAFPLSSDLRFFKFTIYPWSLKSEYPCLSQMVNTRFILIFWKYVNMTLLLTKWFSVFQWKKHPKVIIEAFVLLLAPYAPHMAEELWFRLGHSKSLAYEPFPKVKISLSSQT